MRRKRVRWHGKLKYKGGLRGAYDEIHSLLTAKPGTVVKPTALSDDERAIAWEQIALNTTRIMSDKERLIYIHEMLNYFGWRKS